jgi:hypothetical protein
MLEVYFFRFLLQVIKGWDQGIVGGEGIPPMLAGTSTLNNELSQHSTLNRMYC